jgi:hypothetical protein
MACAAHCRGMMLVGKQQQNIWTLLIYWLSRSDIAQPQKRNAGQSLYEFSSFDTLINSHHGLLFDIALI